MIARPQVLRLDLASFQKDFCKCWHVEKKKKTCHEQNEQNCLKHEKNEQMLQFSKRCFFGTSSYFMRWKESNWFDLVRGSTALKTHEEKRSATPMKLPLAFHLLASTPEGMCEGPIRRTSPGSETCVWGNFRVSPWVSFVGCCVFKLPPGTQKKNIQTAGKCPILDYDDCFCEVFT